MPEHIHLLVLPHKNATVSKILSGVKVSVARLARHWVEKEAPGFLSHMLDIQPDGKKCFRFWQRGGGYDRNICLVEELYEKMNYIHLNPVRRGLVNSPEDWFWSSFRAYEYGVKEPIAVDRESLPPML